MTENSAVREGQKSHASNNIPANSEANDNETGRSRLTLKLTESNY
jgi:hypothetical protein